MESGRRRTGAAGGGGTHPMWARALVYGLLVGVAVLQRPAAAQTCAGDCDGDGAVTVNELVRGVSIALGHLDASQCDALDADGDGGVRIGELIVAVNRALD